ncbi:putative B3 domain-containing protein [Salvia divinorum]|uniref:B3 domain-containing protein n=1 Tax=Salvia divinorum TaxID=28513 RepID=A0ABD1FYU0_SALDI
MKRSNASDDLPEFFKVYTSALSSKLMRIPPDFITKFAGNIPTMCTLERPQIASWQVDVCKVDDCWFFRKGINVPKQVHPRQVEDINKNPNFKTVLTKGYMNKKVVRMPRKFWNAHMKKHERTGLDVTLCVENQEWNVGVRKCHDSILIQKGWPKFVRDNNLKAGTSITFQLTDANHLAFIVTFCRLN